jgi:hypothetical protein
MENSQLPDKTLLQELKTMEEYFSHREYKSSTISDPKFHLKGGIDHQKLADAAKALEPKEICDGEKMLDFYINLHRS